MSFKKVFVTYFVVLFSFLLWKDSNAQQHTITSFNPTSAVSGQLITITGTNYSSITGISIGGATASSYSVVSASTITVTVPSGAQTGEIVISKTGQTDATKSGFVFITPVNQIYTDYGGYWASSASSINTTYPDNSHNLLAFEYGGTIYSTGVSNSTLTSKSITYTSREWQSLPVNNIAGSNTNSVIVYATYADGSSGCNNPSKTIKDVLIDGTRGLNIGTGIANFDSDLEFNVSSIDATKISDSEPDILITQIADPSSNTFDTYKFVTSSGSTVGNSIVATVNQLAPIGTYYIDVYTLTNKSVSNNLAVTNTCQSTNTTRQIRLLALKLSDFGITGSNASTVDRLIITPGGTADYGFIGYNNASFVIPAPTVTAQPTSTIVCAGSGNSTTFSVTVSSTGTTTYQWKKNGTNISGATSSSYTINNITASDAGEYKVEITNSSGSVLSDPAYLNTYISVQPENKSTCINTSISLNINAAGNSPTYQWYSNTTNSNSGGTLITGATNNTYSPSVSTAGIFYYYCVVKSSGAASSCSTDIASSVASITVSAITVAGTISGSASVCEGTNSTTLTLSGNTGNVTKWQSSTTAGFTSATDIASTSTTLTRTNLNTTTYYRAVVTNGSCTSENSNTATITVNNTYTWTGTTNTSFNNASNWQLGCVPISGSNISFATNPTDKCLLGSNVTLGNITINGNSNKHILDINSYTLTIQGTITCLANNIEAKSVTSTIIMQGSSAQSIPESTFVDNTIANLTINNSYGVTIGGPLNLTLLLTMTSGTLNTNGYLTLKSTVSYTAMVGPISYSNAINGNVTVEKYFPARRAFRLISSPVTSTTNIKSNWQEGVNNTSILNYPNNNYDPNPGFGTHIAGSTTGANGFDATQTGNPSLFTYNNGTQSWSNINNTNSNTLYAGNPYRLMIRGSRSVNINQPDNSPTPTNTTLRSTGTLSIGNFSVSGFNGTASANNFIGNPYQCAVDMNTLLNASSNLNKTYYYIWDPFLNSRGGYVTVNVSTNSNAQGSSANKYLQPGQACFVLTSTSPTATPTFTFTEASKYTGSFSTTNYFEIPNEDENQIKVSLISQDSNYLTDATLLNFNSVYARLNNDKHAPKAMNLDENVASILEKKKLSVQCRDIPKSLEKIPLFIDKYRSKNYTLTLDIKGLEFVKIKLFDRYLNQYYPIQTNTYNHTFSVDKTINATTDTNRFELILDGTIQVNMAGQQEIKENNISIINPVVNKTININNTAKMNVNPNYRLYDFSGKSIQIIQIQKEGNKHIIYLPDHLSSGYYLLIFETENGLVTQKVTIE